MLFTKILLGLVSCFNLYWGMRFFLNVIQVLQTTKYSMTTTTILAIVLLGMTAGGVYFTFVAPNFRLAFAIGVGPWVLALIAMIISVIIGYSK